MEIRVYIEISRRRSVNYVPKLDGKHQMKVGVSVINMYTKFRKACEKWCTTLLESLNESNLLDVIFKKFLFIFETIILLSSIIFWAEISLFLKHFRQGPNSSIRNFELTVI